MSFPNSPSGYPVLQFLRGIFTAQVLQRHGPVEPRFGPRFLSPPFNHQGCEIRRLLPQVQRHLLEELVERGHHRPIVLLLLSAMLPLCSRLTKSLRETALLAPPKLAKFPP